MYSLNHRVVRLYLSTELISHFHLYQRFLFEHVLFKKMQPFISIYKSLNRRVRYGNIYIYIYPVYIYIYI